MRKIYLLLGSGERPEGSKKMKSSRSPSTLNHSPAAAKGSKTESSYSMGTGQYMKDTSCGILYQYMRRPGQYDQFFDEKRSAPAGRTSPKGENWRLDMKTTAQEFFAGLKGKNISVIGVGVSNNIRDKNKS